MSMSPLAAPALTASLTASYRQQLDWYTQLRDTMQQELSRVVLSRGDLYGLMGSLERKQQLLNDIVAERNRIRPFEDQWRETKENMNQSQTEPVNGLLDRIEAVIRDFLASEEQLKRYIETQMAPAEKNTAE